MYNFTTNGWKDLSSMTVPHAGFGCVILPQNPNQVLLLGTNSTNDMTRADIYDITTNTWKRAGSSNNQHDGVRLISLGSRVFAIGGNTKGIVDVEYNTIKV